VSRALWIGPLQRGNLRARAARAGRGLALLLCAPLLQAADAPAPAASAAAVVAAADAGHWLTRIQGAAANRSYQGTVVFSTGGVVSSSRVAHLCDGRQRYERIEVLDGRAHAQYRHNDQLLTLWPADKVAVLEQRDPIIDFPGLPAAAGQRALDSYDLQAVGSDRVAGLVADVLLLRPRDGLRFAQRWWAERSTGLLLRSDVLGAKGEVLESSSFVDVSLDTRLSSDAVLGPMKRLDGWRVLRPQAQRTQLDAEGWALARPVPGFQLVSCSWRPLDPAGELPANQPVLQSVFSDGLTHVSVFIEPYDAKRHRQPMRTSQGATHTLMNRHGDWWVTVMGEVPLATAQQFEAALERKH
jgi:sigma-E factor negative regulatory protein RseB